MRSRSHHWYPTVLREYKTSSYCSLLTLVEHLLRYMTFHSGLLCWPWKTIGDLFLSHYCQLALSWHSWSHLGYFGCQKSWVAWCHLDSLETSSYGNCPGSYRKSHWDSGKSSSSCHRSSLHVGHWARLEQYWQLPHSCRTRTSRLLCLCHQAIQRSLRHYHLSKSSYGEYYCLSSWL